MATENVPDGERLESEDRLSFPLKNCIDDMRALLEGIEGISGSYLDHGLLYGLVCDTSSIYALAGMASERLQEMTAELERLLEAKEASHA